MAQRLGFSAQVAVPHTTARGHECPTCALVACFNFRKLNLCRVHSDVLTRHKGCQAIVILIDVKTFVLFLVPLVQASRH